MIRKNSRIQIIRAFSICAVVLIHWSFTGLSGVVTRPFLNFAVAMFLFLSGYLTRIDVEPKEFYKKRLLKVIVPYVIWTIIYGIVFNSGSIIELLITGKSASQMYYILVYIQLILLTPLIVRILKTKWRALGWFISPVAILIIQYVVGKIVGINLMWPFPQTIFFGWFLFYYLGMALGNKIIHYNISLVKTRCFYLLSLVLSIGEGLFWYNSGDFYNMGVTQLRLTSIVASVFACLLAYKYINQDKHHKDRYALKRILISLGDCSGGIYYSHMIFLSFGAIALSELSINTWILPFLALGVSFGIVYTIRKIAPKYS